MAREDFLFRIAISARRSRIIRSNRSRFWEQRGCSSHLLMRSVSACASGRKSLKSRIIFNRARCFGERGAPQEGYSEAATIFTPLGIFPTLQGQSATRWPIGRRSAAKPPWSLRSVRAPRATESCHGFARNHVRSRGGSRRNWACCPIASSSRPLRPVWSQPS